MNRFCTVALVLGLGACAPNMPLTVHDLAAAGPFPNDYKAIVATYIRRSFFDPYSLRDVKISEPVHGWTVTSGGGLLNPADGHTTSEGWMVCVELNGKNRQGGYAGLSRSMYLIHDDQIVRSDSDDPSVCRGASLTPWPEMENIGAGQNVK